MPVPPQWLSLNNLHRDSKLSFDSNDLPAYLFSPCLLSSMHVAELTTKHAVVKKSNPNTSFFNISVLNIDTKAVQKRHTEPERQWSDNNTGLCTCREWYDMICLPWWNFFGTWGNSQQQRHHDWQMLPKPYLQNVIVQVSENKRCWKYWVFLKKMWFKFLF